MLSKQEKKQLLIGIESIDRKIFSKLNLDSSIIQRIIKYSFYVRQAFSVSRFYLKEELDHYLFNKSILKLVGRRSCYGFEYNVKNAEITTVYEGDLRRIAVRTFEPNYSKLIFGEIDPFDNFLEDMQFVNLSNRDILDLIMERIETDKILYLREYKICRGSTTPTTIAFKVSLDSDYNLSISHEVSNKGKLISEKGLRYVSNHIFPLLSDRKISKLLYSKSNINILEAFDKTMLEMLSIEFNRK